jgi:hypothetical protein
MRRYQILLVAMRERTQIEEESTEEGLFNISDVEEQLMSDIARDIESQASVIQNSSHNSLQPQETDQDFSSNSILD